MLRQIPKCIGVTYGVPLRSLRPEDREEELRKSHPRNIIDPEDLDAEGDANKYDVDMDDEDRIYPFLTWINVKTGMERTEDPRDTEEHMEITEDERDVSVYPGNDIVELIRIKNITLLVKRCIEESNERTNIKRHLLLRDTDEEEYWQKPYIDMRDVAIINSRIRRQFLYVMRLFRISKSGWGRHKLISVICLIHQLINDGDQRITVLQTHLHNFRTFTLSWFFDAVTSFVDGVNGGGVVVIEDLEVQEFSLLFEIERLYVYLNILYGYYRRCADVMQQGELGLNLVYDDLLKRTNVKLGHTPQIAEYEKARNMYSFDTGPPQATVPAETNAKKRRDANHPYKRQERQGDRKSEIDMKILLKELLELEPDPNETALDTAREMTNLLASLQHVVPVRRHRYVK